MRGKKGRGESPGFSVSTRTNAPTEAEAKMLYTQRDLPPSPFYHRNLYPLNCGLRTTVVRIFAQVTFEFEHFVFVTAVYTIGRAFNLVATDLSVLFALLPGNITLSQLDDLLSYSVL